MRLVQVIVPTGKREAVRETLEEAGIDYVLTDETSGREYAAVAYFPLPPDAVEPVLDSLHDAGLGEDSYTVVVDAETVISRRFDRLRERYEESEDGDRVARQELRARARDVTPDRGKYLALTVVSVVVATAGVLLDSPAVVVGSMVIAPLIGPAMGTATGSVIDDRELFRHSVKLQILGGVVAVLTAVVFALLVRYTVLVPPGVNPASIGQIRGRAAPGVLSLAVAVGAGIAGALSLSATVSASLVGVAIAVALVPPVAVIGIGVAYDRPLVALGALVLVLVNYLSINAAAMATLWYEGYRPETLLRFGEARLATLRRIAVLGLGILALSAFLGGVTYTTYQAGQFEAQVEDAVRATLAEPAYDDLTLLDVRVEYGDEVLFQQPRQVVVIVGRPSNGGYPDLAAAIDRAIQRRTGRDVAVQVRFVEVSRADVKSPLHPASGSSSPDASRWVCRRDCSPPSDSSRRSSSPEAPRRSHPSTS